MAKGLSWPTPCAGRLRRITASLARSRASIARRRRASNALSGRAISAFTRVFDALWDGSNETSPPKALSAARGGCARAAGHVAPRLDADLPVASRAHHCRARGGRRHRHRGAPDRPVAVRAARSVVRHRKPAGRRRQCRHRGGGERARRRLHAAGGQPRRRHQRDALRQARLRLPARHGAGGGAAARRQRHGGDQHAAGADRAGVHRLRESQAGPHQLRFHKRVHARLGRAMPVPAPRTISPASSSR